MNGGFRPCAGLDLVEVERFAAALARRPRLEQRLFTEQEAAPFRSRPGRARHLAARFAAKEAVGKLLGCGVTSWREIEVAVEAGAPRVRLYGRARRRAEELGLGEVALSLSHTDTIAAACAFGVAGSVGAGNERKADT